jgi:hypothetical protein
MFIKMKIHFVFILFLLISDSSNSQTYDWSWATNPITNSAGGNSIVTDDRGNSYVTGSFSGSPSYFGNFILNSTGAQNDIFIVKYDSTGNVLWAKSGISANHASEDYGLGISLDQCGYCYITGLFQDTIIFDTDTIFEPYGSNPSGGIYIAKYDTSGNILWIKSTGSKKVDFSYSIINDSIGNSYITGSFSDTVYFGIDTLICGGVKDIIIASYDSFGNERWARKAGGNFTDEGLGITLSNNSIYVTGYFTKDCIFDSDTLLGKGANEIFIARYDTSGNKKWVRSAGGTRNDVSTAIKIGKNGDVFITGCTRDTALFNTDTIMSNGFFVAKYDTSGNFHWVKHETSNSTSTTVNEGFGITTDSLGNCIVTGRFKGSSNFGNYSLFATDLNMFVSKLDINGNVIWYKSVGSNGSVYGNGISSDFYQNYFITGSYSTDAQFGSTNLFSNSDNMFIAKLGCELPPPEISVNNGVLHSTTSFLYQWFLNENLITGAEYQDYTPVQNGTYIVRIVDTNGCVGYSEEFIFNRVGIFENEIEKYLSVTPNPSDGIFCFNYTFSNDEIVEIEILNLLGENITVTNKNEINLSNENDGIYFYNLKTKLNVFFSGKIIKQ